MKDFIELHIYSGVSNPKWKLTEEEKINLLEKINQESKETLKKSSNNNLVGYRGFEIHLTDDNDSSFSFFVFNGIIDFTNIDKKNLIDTNSEVEKFLLSTEKADLSTEIKKYVTEEIDKKLNKEISKSIKNFEINMVKYDPGKWNNDFQIKENNNCYNYANDKITGTFAQPGRGSGQIGPNPATVVGTSEAALRDGLSGTDEFHQPNVGQCVALFIWPGKDFHWYRLDDKNYWSHKPGKGNATNLDNKDKPIKDPKECDRGPYTEFAGFYISKPGDIKIK